LFILVYSYLSLNKYNLKVNKFYLKIKITNISIKNYYLIRKIYKYVLLRRMMKEQQAQEE